LFQEVITMTTTTVRLPVEQRDSLKIIASVEKRDIQDILTEVVDEYIERHRETLEILARPDWAEAIREGLEAADRGDTVPWRQKKRSGK